MAYETLSASHSRNEAYLSHDLSDSKVLRSNKWESFPGFDWETMPELQRMMSKESIWKECYSNDGYLIRDDFDEGNLHD